MIKIKKNWFKEIVGKLRKKPKPLFKSGAFPQSETPSISITRSSIGDIAWESSGINYANFNNGTDTTPENPSISKFNESIDNRIEKKPIEIWKELCFEVPKIDFSQLDLQIKTVEKRKKILEEEIGITISDEKIALKYLYARRKLRKIGKNEFLWQTTTNELIEKLRKNYKIKIVNFPNYYKCVPNEALEQLEKYSKAWRKITEEVPEIKLIIDEGGKEDKKDPILIVSSPFGNWWFILGAWDKEVEYVDEIVYGGK